MDLRTYKKPDLSVDKKFRPLILISLALLLHLPFLNASAVLFLMHLGLLSTLYNVPEKSKGIIRFPLRSIPILKIFLISYVWASIASFLPSFVQGQSVLTGKNCMLFTAHFLFIFAITLPFDIRDFKADSRSKLLTFPRLTGIFHAKIISLICLSGFTCLIFLVVRSWYIPVFSLITALLILNSSVKRPDYYFTFYMDGTIILYFIALIVS